MDNRQLTLSRKAHKYTNNNIFKWTQDGFISTMRSSFSVVSVGQGFVPWSFIGPESFQLPSYQVYVLVSASR